MSTAPLQLPGDVHVAQLDTLLDDLAGLVLRAAFEAVQDRGLFHLALSGGATPEPLYRRLMIDPRFRSLPWEQTGLWLVDERQVPPNDPRSNFGLIRDMIVAHAPVRQRNVHPINVAAADPAGEYEAALRRVLGADAQPRDESPDPASTGIPRLDLVLLGMGGDGHTASLFPHSPALEESQRWVVVNHGPHVTPPPRLTMTYPLLNAARRVAVLVTGAAKHATLRRVEQQLTAAGPDPRLLPITGIAPRDGEMSWWLDDQASQGESQV